MPLPLWKMTCRPAKSSPAGFAAPTASSCVGEYDDAETAIAELPQKKPSVVLFDINLPGMNGIECVRRLKPQPAGHAISHGHGL